MPEYAEQKSSEYGDFLRSDNHDENAIKIYHFTEKVT